MIGFNIDDSPDKPVGSPDMRRTVAIHWWWTTEYDREEIADALGVRKQTISRYLNSEPGKEVEEQLADIKAEVRLVAIEELKDQLRRAGHESKTAETPVAVWTNENGDLLVQDQVDDDGNVVDRFPVPNTFDMGDDKKARYYRREEVREILDQLCDLVGAKEPDELKVEHEVADAWRESAKEES